MDFFMPTRLYTGEGCVAKHAADLLELGTSCLIVCSPHAAKTSGALDDATAALDSVGISYAIFDGIRENPPVAACAEAGRMAAGIGAAFVLGIGGGSPLDAAKAVAVFAANPGLDEGAFYAKNWGHEPLPIALIGTTAGTGSEVTPVSVLTDAAGRKHSIRDGRLYARLALGDSAYTLTCPHTVALTCSVDVLAHAIEGYFSKKADPISRAFSVAAVRHAYMPMCTLSKGERLTPDEARELYEASILAGLTINTTSTCFPHNVGYILTENHGVPHGFACAVFLPELLNLVSAYDPEYADAFFRDCGISEVALVRLIKSCLPEFKIHMTEAEVDAALPRWENNGSVNNTRADVSAEDIRTMLLTLFA